jgi:soluble lytic murein transglycosylase
MNPRIPSRTLYIIVALLLVIGVALGASLRSETEAEAQGARRGNPGDAAIRDLRSLVARTNGEPSAADLMQFESSHGGTKAAALARFLRGYRAAEAKDWSAALVALDSGDIEQRTALADYALFYKGRALAELNRYADAERFLDDVQDKYPDSLLARDGALEAARAAMRAGKPSEALEDLERLVALGDGEASVMAADIHSQRGDSARAAALYRRAYYYDPASPAAASALGQLVALGASPEGATATEEELLTRGNKLFAAEKWADAQAAYGRLLTLHPGVAQRNQIAVRRATAAANAKDVLGASAAVQMVPQSEPDLHAEALYQLATAYRRAGQAEEFEQTGQRLRSMHPKSEAAGKFLADYVDLLESRKRPAEAFALERELTTAYPHNADAARRSYETAWALYKTGDYRGAAERFTDHLATFRTPTSKWIGEAAFWGGRAWERLGNVPRALLFYEMARDRYPYGYHGHVSMNRIKRLTSGAKAKAEVPEPGSALARAKANALAVEPIVETADDSVDPRFERATDLETIALWDHATAEIASALDAFPSSPRVALRYAQMFSRRGDNFQATVILRKGYPDVYSYRDDQLPREAWEILFPLTHWDHIKRTAAANGLDPFLVAGLIRQESVFNPRALSRANARGMMQLLPSTGRLVARSSGLGAVGPADLYNPSLNITLGTAYLAQQMQKFGRIELAAAAYNAGPGRVVQWKAQRPVEPIEEWVENIPFSETRGYVQGVLRYAANYRRFYGQGAERESAEW